MSVSRVPWKIYWTRWNGKRARLGDILSANLLILWKNETVSFMGVIAV